LDNKANLLIPPNRTTDQDQSPVEPFISNRLFQHAPPFSLARLLCPKPTSLETYTAFSFSSAACEAGPVVAAWALACRVFTTGTIHGSNHAGAFITIRLSIIDHPLIGA